MAHIISGSEDITDEGQQARIVRETRVKIIIAGGGTGGHLFPGMAVAEEIQLRYANSEILFVTGKRKIESNILMKSGFKQVSLMVEGIKGKGWIKGIGVILKLPFSLIQSCMIIKNYSPDLILGVGGYSAGPVCLAGRMMGIPTAIHEQNSFPGLTNRILSRLVDRIFISFEESREYFSRCTPIFSGNPVREALVMKERTAEDPEREFTILVTGGSQGAVSVNTAVIEALEILKRKGHAPGVLHQAGEKDFSRVIRMYHEKHIDAEVVAFIEDMEDAYHRAHIVISRAGATTISELAVLGKPSILIPYPYAANNHQETNALALVRAGGAEMVVERDLNGEVLSDLLLRYMDDMDALRRLSEGAKKMGHKNAASIIVSELAEMIGR